MMPSNGPPTPQGVGGPTPPLVSRGSEEEEGKGISSKGLPPTGRKGHSASPARVEEEWSAPNGEGEKCRRSFHGDMDLPPTLGQRGECTSMPDGVHNRRGGRAEGRGENGNSQQQRPDKATRRSHTSRELRMLDPENKLPPKRARRPTRGMTTDTQCEATRESNMICPTTCGCHNSLRDIEEKTHIVSQTLRSTRQIRKNELIAVFGLTATITNKPEILALNRPWKNVTQICIAQAHNIRSKEISTGKKYTWSPLRMRSYSSRTVSALACVNN